MKQILIKEFKTIFGSITGVISGGLFVVVSSMMLWLLPGEYNLLEGGYASIDPFFRIVYNMLLLILPAWVMSAFAEERRLGTWELLSTSPVSLWGIVVGKYLAYWLGFACILCVSLLTIVPILFLTTPIGYVDVGVWVASIVGVLLISAGVLAVDLLIGYFVRNLIGAFLLSIAANGALFYGFDLAAEWVRSTWAEPIFTYLSFGEHYRSVVKGMLDSRDLVYFLTLVGGGSIFFMRRPWWAILSLAAVNVCSYFFYIKVDLTSDRRFSLSDFTKERMRQNDRPMEAVFLLTGDLNSGFRRLEEGTKELLNECRSYAGQLRTVQLDPMTDSSGEQIQSLLQRRGLSGVAVNERNDRGELRQQTLFPYLMLIADRDTLVVNLLENDPSRSGAENLNRSIELLEYKFIQSMINLQGGESKRVAFLEGHGEIAEPHASRVLDLIGRQYYVFQGDIPAQEGALTGFSAVVVANPRSKFSSEQLSVLDGYVRGGGSLLLSLSPVEIRAAQDERGVLLAHSVDLGWQELLFAWGVRIGSDLVLDSRCGFIPIQSEQGADIEPAPWYYSPVFLPLPNLPIWRKVDPIRLDYAQSIELVDRKEGVHYEPLLVTSPEAIRLQTPQRVDLRMVEADYAESVAERSSYCVGMLLEGVLPSLYEGRLSPIDKELVVPRRGKSAKVSIVTSPDFLANKIDLKSGVVQPIGFDRFASVTYGNEPFIRNLMMYLCGDQSLLSLTEKRVELRLLDRSKRMAFGGWMRWSTLVIPLAILAFGVVVLILVRRRKYGQSTNN